MPRRLPLSALLLIALAVTSLIPRGWMPVTNDSGKVVMVICTAYGVEERVVDLGDAAPHDDSDPRASSTCPFAAVQTADLSLYSPVAVNAVTPVINRWQHRDFTHRSAGFHWRYDARGPPHLS